MNIHSRLSELEAIAGTRAPCPSCGGGTANVRPIVVYDDSPVPPCPACGAERLVVRVEYIERPATPAELDRR